MTKEKFASQLAKEMRTAGIKINVESAEKLIEALGKSMNEGLACDRKLIVSNFGSFEVITYGAKIINSPRGDKKKFFMPPTDVIKWHPSGKVRMRAGSTQLPMDEYQKLIGNAYFEDEPAVAQTDAPIDSEAKIENPFEVSVRFAGKSKSYLTDQNSPISKLIKSLLRLMSSFGADKLEIIPERSVSKIIYLSGNETKNQRLLPKESHTVVIEAIKMLAGDSSELQLSDHDRAKLSQTLTQFGQQLIITRV